VEGVMRGRLFRRLNVVAALCGQTVLAPLCYEHTTMGEFFENWFGEELLKCVPAGSTVMMDNASVHCKKKLYVLVAGTGISLLFSPYSPNFNPIEKKWANLKKALPDTTPKFDPLQGAVYNYLEHSNS
jgi:hypothetical protein